MSEQEQGPNIRSLARNFSVWLRHTQYGAALDFSKWRKADLKVHSAFSYIHRVRASKEVFPAHVSHLQKN